MDDGSKDPADAQRYADANSRQKALVQAALKQDYNTPGMCAAFVSYCFEDAGYGFPGGNACDMYEWWCHSSDMRKLKVGMIVACAPSGATSSIYGHVAIYIGDGNVIHNPGGPEITSLQELIDSYGPNGRYHGGEVRWGWASNIDLANMQ